LLLVDIEDNASLAAPMEVDLPHSLHATTPEGELLTKEDIVVAFSPFEDGKWQILDRTIPPTHTRTLPAALDLLTAYTSYQ
jgi:hypothetical protein